MVRPAILTLCLLVLAVPANAKKPRKPDESDKLFTTGPIPHLKIQITNEELQKLRQNPRAYAKCTVIEDDKKTYTDVGVKLKGAAGSFRHVDDRPALTVNFDKFNMGQEFHGLDKIHLNNSVQDGTFLHELMSSEICAIAGVPATRATHARVWLNGRDLGFYGLKEGFDAKFLRRHFDDSKGNLYDGGFCQDIDAALQKDSGTGPDDRSDLRELVTACRLPDAAARWQKVEQLVDIDAFLDFMAVELMMCHWDGYCNNRNNYRVYFDSTNKKAYFFPHGMDQMFGDTNAGVLHTPGALVSATIMSNPVWRARYRERLDMLIAKLFAPPDKLLAKVDAVHARIRPVLAAINEGTAQGHDGQVRGLKDRLIARGKNLEQQAATPEPRPLTFNAQGIASVTKWLARAETQDMQQSEVTVDGVKAYTIASGPGGRCVASWRAKVMLSAGTYQFKARVKSNEITRLPTDTQAGIGAGLRVSGGQRTNSLEGTSPWKVVEHELTIVEAMQEVELVAELRATRGQVWFDAGSLQLVRVKK